MSLLFDCGQQEFLRSSTLFPKFLGRGSDIIITSSKHKLLSLLTYQLPPACRNWAALSVEALGEPSYADAYAVMNQRVHEFCGKKLEDLRAEVGPFSTIYSERISVQTLRLASLLLRERRKRSTRSVVLYMSTTDYIQHKTAPGSQEANSLMASLDQEFGFLEEVGGPDILLGISADHGMSDKTRQGSPDIVYIDSLLQDAGYAGKAILPITDPYVRHHGALGGFASVYIWNEKDKRGAFELLSTLGKERNFTVFEKEIAAQLYELPEDRIGDFILISSSSVVFGKSEDFHDLSMVPALRSHGGEGSDQEIPLIFSGPVNRKGGAITNRDLFPLLMNS